MSSSRPLLLLINLSIERDWVQKKKESCLFKGFLIILFQNILLLKQFPACNDCSGLFTKIIKRSWTSFCCTFSARLVNKNVLYLILYLWTKCRYQTKCVNELLFRQLTTSWTLRFIFNHTLKQWPTGRKRGKDRNTKIWISRERKKLFRWNKKHFS